MKIKLLLLAFAVLILNCTKGVVPRVGKIEVLYIGSISQDIYRESPISSCIADSPVIKVAYTTTEPVFMEYYLYRMGLSDLLSKLDIDYVIGDTSVQNHEFFSIPKSMGYAITNFGGIRFAVVSSKDSLTIDDQVQLSLIEERSDVLWVIDRTAFNLEPSLISFYISGRVLADTSISPIRVSVDTARARQIKDFQNKIETELGRSIKVDGRIDDHLFSVISDNALVDVVVYPQDLFFKIIETDEVSLRELMSNVAFETKFKKTEMSGDMISEIYKANDYNVWGEIKMKNTVLLPDEAGQHIFDFYSKKE